MRAYRQWLNGVRRRAAVRSRMWRAIEAALAGASAPRITRVGAALATAAALAAAVGLAAKFGEARTQEGRTAQAAAPSAASAAGAAQPIAAPDAR